MGYWREKICWILEDNLNMIGRKLEHYSKAIILKHRHKPIYALWRWEALHVIARIPSVTRPSLHVASAGVPPRSVSYSASKMHHSKSELKSHAVSSVWLWLHVGKHGECMWSCMWLQFGLPMMLAFLTPSNWTWWHSGWGYRDGTDSIHHTDLTVIWTTLV